MRDLSAADWAWCQAYDPGSTHENYPKFRVKMLRLKLLRYGNWSLGKSDIQVGMTILVL